ncbi:alpha/beta fold hydrolase [Paenibacillus terrae]|uniref:Alpha/beta hydrolase n=1 Tax=Paenibacillus terrae TaxID=159743 RepID=A0A0D7X882_9BACL|nr:alpha/beta hydrolase [Paenibacillus terrae]KJD47218.1 alpha/beta hydrolase [Paenibacillus terrae]
MEKVLCEGTTICYAEQGKGEPIILLHGFCGSSSYWDEVVPLLSQSYRCIVPDLRGHGRSDAPLGAYTIDQMANDVLKLQEQLDIPKAAWFGHSLGGYLTLSAVQRHPERLTAFGLIHSTAYADTEEGKEKRNKAVSTIQTEGITTFVDGLVPRLFAPEHVESLSNQVLKVKEIGYKTPPQGAVGTSLAMRERSDRRDVLSASTLPTLLVAGEQDQAVPPARTFTTDRAGVTQVTISEVGHMSLFEAPEQLAHAILAFLQQNIQQ